MNAYKTFTSAGNRQYIEVKYIWDQTVAPSTRGWFDAVIQHMNDIQGERSLFKHGAVMYPQDAVKTAFKEVKR